MTRAGRQQWKQRTTEDREVKEEWTGKRNQEFGIPRQEVNYFTKPGSTTGQEVNLFIIIIIIIIIIMILFL